jgi:phosphohistidine phosphatase
MPVFVAGRGLTPHHPTGMTMRNGRTYDPGMKRLYVLRHAKSSWDDADLADHDRPLSGRGRRAADAIGRHLRAHGIEPELVLCSSAARTRETLARIGLEGTIERELYGAGAGELLARLRDVPPGIQSVLVIGHNPGMHDLALALSGEPGDKYPTGALATIELDIGDWSAIAPGSGRMIGFVRPRELA